MPADKSFTVTVGVIRGLSDKSNAFGAGKPPFARGNLVESVSSPGLSPRVQRWVEAAERARIFLVPGNQPRDFHLKAGREVDPGSMASNGTDARGNSIWVVDQRVNFSRGTSSLPRALLDGFFSRALVGPDGRGPTVTLLAVERKGAWQSPLAGGHSTAKNPFRDASVSRFIMEIGNVHPLPLGKNLIPAGTMALLVDKESVISSPDQATFTAHFLNPHRRNGPVPGDTDGAVRFRAARHSDGSMDMEAYYVTRAATEFVRTLREYFPPARMVSSLLSLGGALYERAPMGWLAASFFGGAEKLANKAIGASDVVRMAVATLHARYYRTILFPALLKTGSSR